MNPTVFNLLYLVAAVGFIFGLRLQSNPATASRGNRLAFLAMALAILVSLFYPLENGSASLVSYAWIIGAMLFGSVIGYRWATKVEMTGMPQLVSMFNGLGGLSAVFISLVELLKLNGAFSENAGLSASSIFALVIGSIAFSGSILAFLKLDGRVKDKHVTYTGQKWVNNILLVALLGLCVALYFINVSPIWIIVLVLLALVYGFSFVAPIGGADMPVVISLLNSFTGLTAAAAGLIYNNQVMLLGGILVGASGTILTILMCQAMNRSLWNVIAGNFAAAAGGAKGEDGDQAVREANITDVAVLTYYADKVIIVPGYGLAVAQAQQALKQVYDILKSNGVEVLFGIHPVAGRMPGHMNVLLAEVDIPYEDLLDLDETNEQLGSTDVVLIIGANDVVNPSALDDPGSSIYGMPVLEVWRAKQTIVCKRSMSTGYAGIQNPLFFKANNQMLFGDAKASLNALGQELKEM